MKKVMCLGMYVHAVCTVHVQYIATGKQSIIVIEFSKINNYNTYTLDHLFQLQIIVILLELFSSIVNGKIESRFTYLYIQYICMYK